MSWRTSFTRRKVSPMSGLIHQTPIWLWRSGCANGVNELVRWSRCDADAGQCKTSVGEHTVIEHREVAALSRIHLRVRDLVQTGYVEPFTSDVAGRAPLEKSLPRPSFLRLRITPTLLL